MEFFTKATYCIVTGASTGLGKELAIQLAKEWSAVGSMIVLVARNAVKLEETKNEITKTSPKVQVDVIPADLSNLETLPDVCKRLLSGYNSHHYSQGAVFHNAGSLGDISRPTGEQSDPFEITKYLTLNFTSMWSLTSQLLTLVHDTHPCFIMNMTSLIAKYPSGGLAAYGSMKAARNVFFESLALEYPTVRILNYSPGPCDTDMFSAVKSDVYCEETKRNFEKMRALTVTESINKLMTIIKEDSFKNGAIIDYYD